MQCGRYEYEIVCPEIGWQEEDESKKYLLIPEFMIPGRPYPIYVYLYGITLYTSNLKMGQREAAEKTRKQFGLETFSHTTLGRAMKKLEGLISREGAEAKTEEAGALAARSENGGKFPTVEQIKERKEKVISYITEAAGENVLALEEAARQNYKRPPYGGGFIETCHNAVINIFLKYRRLLL